MRSQFHNDLRFYTLSINESADLAESTAQEFEDKFNSLGKYEQMDISLVVQLDGWEAAFERLG